MNPNQAIQNPENVCFNCLKETAVHKIKIPALGWGSQFDNFSTKIQLCDDCYSVTNPDWWKLNVIKGKTDLKGEHYEYEDEILKFVEQMPLAGQELFWNRYTTGAFVSYYMESQDWIDYELDLLPYEKCKDYGLYSPQEKEAYQSRFPICDKVKIVVYNDGSKGSRCPFGNGDGTAKGHQTQSKCYECIMFAERKQDIETYSEEDMKIFTLEQKLALAKVMKKIKEIT